MEKNCIDIDTSIRSALTDRMSLSDLESVRLILEGNSIIDWNRANFRNNEEAEEFLQLHHFNLSNPLDVRRLKYLREASIAYLEDQFNLRFPDDIKFAQDMRSILVMASQTGGFRRRQILCCVILKLMHVLQHLDAAELRHKLPLAEADLLELASKKIDKSSRDMRKSGLPIVSFYGSRKARNSIITKLLAKSDNIAATVFDKLRYRIVTETRSAIVPTLVWLARNLFPFNYVIPGESHNNLLEFESLTKQSVYRHLLDELQSNGIEKKTEMFEVNGFSGSNYRIINFIVDVPVRVDHIVPSVQYQTLGNIVYVMVEFQILDKDTALLNEQGDSAHSLYKQRQLEQVQIRLRKGGRKKRDLSKTTEESEQGNPKESERRSDGTTSG